MTDEDDDSFVKLLGEMMLANGWPTEADDYRQWLLAGLLHEPFAWVLQQYGCPASILDFTSDLDVALFFAQAVIENGCVKLPEPSDSRVLYVFVESGDSECFASETNGAWREIDASGANLPARIRAQRCGYLRGSSFLRQNFYGHLIAARIQITGASCVTTLCPGDLFPEYENDQLLQTLRQARPVPQGLY